jgi:hypothetical protein
VVANNHKSTQFKILASIIKNSKSMVSTEKPASPTCYIDKNNKRDIKRKKGYFEGTLLNIQIEKMMQAKNPTTTDLISVFAINNMCQQVPKACGDKKTYSFITNTSLISSPHIGHWVTVRMNPKTLKYYDLLAFPPPKTC